MDGFIRMMIGKILNHCLLGVYRRRLMRAVMQVEVRMSRGEEDG